jgi:AraC-like DNA-binding protein
MEKAVHLKYLIVNENDLQWGITCNTVGFQHVASNEPYPPNNHPIRYLFSKEKGRILDEYQLLYITRGKGVFSSDKNKEQPLKEGNMFLLFPNEWHSYFPDNQTGWDEYWIGFKGINIDARVDSGFFNKQKAVFNVGVNDEIALLYEKAIQIAQEQTAGFQQMLAGIVNMLLGIAFSYNKNRSFENSQTSQLISKAKIIMQEKYLVHIQPETISQYLNISYSGFRKVFKEYTGFTPSQYMQELRVRKAKELLTNTEFSIKEIAYMAGFENVEHFFVAFRKKTEMTPGAYRKYTQGVEN